MDLFRLVTNTIVASAQYLLGYTFDKNALLLNVYQVNPLMKKLHRPTSSYEGFTSFIIPSTSTCTKVLHDQKHIRDGIKSLQNMLSYINWFHAIPHTIAMSNELGHYFSSQTIERELENHKSYHTLFEFDSIIIPKVISERSDSFEMTKLSPSNCLTTDSRTICAGQLVFALVKGLKSGIIHGDLHPDNIFYYDDTIGIIDFGLMVKLDASQSGCIISMLHDLTLKKYAEASYHIMIMIPEIYTISDLDMNDISQFCIFILKRAIFINGTFTLHDILEFDKKVHTYGLCLPPIMYRLGYALQSMNPVIKDLDIHLDDFIKHLS